MGVKKMGYFAKITNNLVIDVITISDEVLGEPTLSYPDTDGAGRAFIANTLKLPGLYLQTSYDGDFRGTYASEGYTYDSVLDIFIAPPNDEETE